MFWRLIPGPRSETSNRTCPFDAGRRNADPGPGGVWQRVVEQDHAAPGPRVRGRSRARSAPRSSSSSTSDSCRAGGRRELGRDLARELADVRRLEPQLQRARLQPREVQQLDGQVAHPVDLPADLLQERLAASPRRGPRRPAARGTRRARRSASRSSCDAEAMNCLRARSSRASWSCMSSKAAASRPSSSSESALIGWRSRRRRPCAPRARAASRAPTAPAPTR